MKRKMIGFLVTLVLVGTIFTGCGEYTPTVDGSAQDMYNTIQTTSDLQASQPTPTDIDFSLERYNLIKRAYWVNGQREKAMAVPCKVERPLGYILLLTDAGAPIGRFVVDGKVSSLNSFLTPDSEFYEQEYGSNGLSIGDGNDWLADVDGSYGQNDNGIFFFTPDGNYWEWTGTYLYSDVPFEIDNPMLKIVEE